MHGMTKRLHLEHLGRRKYSIWVWNNYMHLHIQMHVFQRIHGQHRRTRRKKKIRRKCRNVSMNACQSRFKDSDIFYVCQAPEERKQTISTKSDYRLDHKVNIRTIVSWRKSSRLGRSNFESVSRLQLIS